jgi:hypothetical protein
VTADLDPLQARIAEAGEHLARISGDASLCTMSRSGQPAPAVKYHEGQWAALREVAKRVRAGGDVTAETAAARGRWAADLDRLTERGAGRDWIAYRTGGLDALDELLTASA